MLPSSNSVDIPGPTVRFGARRAQHDPSRPVGQGVRTRPSIVRASVFGKGDERLQALVVPCPYPITRR